MAAARVELAQIFRVKVGNLIKQYVETTGGGDSETVDQVTSSTTRLITNQTLAGSRLFRQRANPETGTLYVLVGMDEGETTEALVRSLKEAQRTSRGNEQAAWQRLQAESSHEELAEAIAEQ